MNKIIKTLILFFIGSIILMGIWDYTSDRKEQAIKQAEYEANSCVVNDCTKHLSCDYVMRAAASELGWKPRTEPARVYEATPIERLEHYCKDARGLLNTYADVEAGLR